MRSYSRSRVVSFSPAWVPPLSPPYLETYFTTPLGTVTVRSRCPDWMTR
jgi:hypothetical protein